MASKPVMRVFLLGSESDFTHSPKDSATPWTKDGVVAHPSQLLNQIMLQE